MLFFPKTTCFTINYATFLQKHQFLRCILPFLIPFGTGRGQWRSKAELGRAEPSRAEPGRAGPSRAEPSRAEPSRARAEPSRAEPGRAELRRADPSRAEPNRADSSRAVPNRAKPSRTGGDPHAIWCKNIMFYNEFYIFTPPSQNISFYKKLGDFAIKTSIFTMKFIAHQDRKSVV